MDCEQRRVGGGSQFFLRALGSAATFEQRVSVRCSKGNTGTISEETGAFNSPWSVHLE